MGRRLRSGDKITKFEDLKKDNFSLNSGNLENEWPRMRHTYMYSAGQTSQNYAESSTSCELELQIERWKG